MFKVGIIGCGRAASILEDDPLRSKPCTHMGAYVRNPRTKVIAVCDIDTKKLDLFRKRWGDNFNFYTDYRVMLEKEDLDIVSICALAPERCQMILDAIDAGVKGIWAEKALATSIEEGERILSACTEKKVSLIVNHTRRWDPYYKKVKEIIEGRELGNLISITGYFSGNLVHTGTHMFDTMRFFAGEPDWVFGVLDEKEIMVKDSGYFYDETGIEYNDFAGYGIMHFENDVVANVVGRSLNYFIFELDLVFDEGRIKIGNDIRKMWKKGKSRNYTGFEELFEVDFPEPNFPPQSNSWILALEDLIASMENGSSNQVVKEALKDLEIAIAFHISNNEKRKIPLPLEGKYKQYRVISR